MLLTIEKKSNLAEPRCSQVKNFVFFSSRSEFSVGKNQLGSFSIKLFGLLRKNWNVEKMQFWLEMWLLLFFSSFFANAQGHV